MAVLEVEQKFGINGDSTDPAIISSKLERLGFERKGVATVFTDWYFDSPTTLTLSLQDCWLRYREMNGKGQWQLKCGQQLSKSSATKGLTVYQEVEGQEAVDMALSMLESYNLESFSRRTIKTASSDPVLDVTERIIPKLPTDKAHSLKLFARFTTTRSSWVLKHKHDTSNNVPLVEILGDVVNAIQVDLDATDTNYAVGEVEIVVEKEDQVANAKSRIQQVITAINGDKDLKLDERTSQTPPQGKLEHFLFHYRPNHYQALVEAGILN
jgi:hypothetical protein